MIEVLSFSGTVTILLIFGCTRGFLRLAERGLHTWALLRHESELRQTYVAVVDVLRPGGLLAASQPDGTAWVAWTPPDPEAKPSPGEAPDEAAGAGPAVSA